MISQLENEKKVVGVKQTRKAVLSGRAKTVFLACDADPAVTGPVEALCREQNVPLEGGITMKELGSQCGISVGAAAAALLRE
ncbi:MAG: ribosomal L7Ae/L30e/S12e/Gadd45 family protein [Clostridiales bacterium]|nr:ribosomal L7Ae/L30e/S12e/Gadd45 family protein [Clostridiales bacterium]